MPRRRVGCYAQASSPSFRWNVIALIDLYREYPLLWDVKHPEHKDKIKANII